MKFSELGVLDRQLEALEIRLDALLTLARRRLTTRDWLALSLLGGQEVRRIGEEMRRWR